VRVVVTGGAGFVGSHLCERLIQRGDAVVCVDNLATGRIDNIAHLLPDPQFDFLPSDVSVEIPINGPVDAVAHLASPASPPDYLRLPLETLSTGSRGTENALRLACAHGSRFLLASTSEVYGDPAVHPQPEEYWGQVNPIGPRSVYDESKRFAEAVTMAYRRTLDTNVGIARIFNTFGPRMRPHDGRVVTNFIAQALLGDPLTIYGDGSQTRSFCYVDDLVRGLLALLDSEESGPINLGNPTERTVAEFASLILELTQSSSAIEYHPLPVDDPTRRRPVIRRAEQLLGWRPEVPLEEGLRRTVEWFETQPDDVLAARTAIAGGQLDGHRQAGGAVDSETILPAVGTPDQRSNSAERSRTSMLAEFSYSPQSERGNIHITSNSFPSGSEP
jgi:dTDP-glucose 4,6-dehydratase